MDDPFLDGDYFEFAFKLEARELRAYIEASEKAFDDAFTAFGERVEAIEAEMLPKDLKQYHDFMADEAFALAERFPQFGRHMAFAAAFNQSERFLIKIADNVGRRLKLGFTVKDVHGQGIDAARNYLSKGASVTEPFGSKGWQHIVVYGKIRNLITHENSAFPDYLQLDETKAAVKKEAFEKLIYPTGPIDIDDFGRFSLSKEYCLTAIDTIEVFFVDLLPHLPK